MNDNHNWEYNKEVNRYWVSLICKRCGTYTFASSEKPHEPYDLYTTCNDELVKKILNE